MVTKRQWKSMRHEDGVSVNECYDGFEIKDEDEVFENLIMCRKSV